MNVRQALRNGFIIGTISIFIILLGLTVLVGGIVRGWFDLSSNALGAWVLLGLLALLGGVNARRNTHAASWKEAAVAGLAAGVAQGAMVGIFVGIVATLIDSGTEVRQWLVQLTPEAIDLLRFGAAPVAAALIVFAIFTLAGLLGALPSYASAHYQWGAAFRSWFWGMRDQGLDLPPVAAFREYKYAPYIVYGLGLVLLLIAPQLLGRYWNYTLGTVGIYVILGLGLNIVVGLAGLLDLGYVAFFAIGAYTVAMLTAPAPHNIGMSFWLVLPIGVVLASITGVLLGIPVLRMRGDYLAIVTLGFGEIIRILSKSDVLTSFTGGPRGIRAVAGPSLFGMDLSSSQHFMYFIILGIILVAYLTYRLQNSRVGRAWMAMREDEDVAEAMGIYTLKYKLLAFAIGAAFAGFGGVLFASRNKFTGPEDFTLLVSINVLCLVIIGGMGSIPGVVIGALVLKGLPEMLRELDDYRILVFGALLVMMMILRPEGLLPSKRRRMELHEEEPTEVVAAGGAA
ncbi:MAG: leucine/isoleucine/valine transporter permease subunit [Anaerolineae bacterium]|nr:leucine/isoleucine/valine transporter permease subunit [Anaerolineae bacterium]